MNFQLITKISTVFIVISTVFSCQNKNEDTAENVALATDFIMLKSESQIVTQTYPGMIEGQDFVEIKAQANGYLEAVYVHEGQYVSKGQALFKIQSDVYEEQVNQNNAALKSAIALQANARLEQERLQPLVDGKVVSSIELKTAQTNYDVATAQVSQAKSVLGSSKIHSNFTTIKAPVEGYIGRIPYRVGNLVTTNDAIPLTNLSNIKAVNVYFSMSEADFYTYNKARLETDKTSEYTELLLPDGSLYTTKGKLQPASGNINANTGSIAMKAVFQNPDGLLRAGGTAKVFIRRKVDNVLVVPKTAVKDIQDMYFVFLLNAENKVKMVAVEVSGDNPDFFYVKSGINPGDKMAVNRVDILKEDMLVQPTIVTKQ